jgi:hypothetical protein
MTQPAQIFEAWFEALYVRHTAALQFAEIRRALQALSDLYVHGRHRLAGGDVFAGRGKRAAFALYYAPLHYLLIQRVIADAPLAAGGTLMDLGCGTGAGAAAWGSLQPLSRLVGYDLQRWALEEARWNWQQMQLPGRTHCANVAAAPIATLGPGDGILAAFLVNELPEAARVQLLQVLLAAHRRGATVCIVEPIAKRVAPWWPVWEQAFVAAGGRSATWRVPTRLPPQLALLDKASGLRHDVLKGRSLHLDHGQAHAMGAGPAAKAQR